MRKKLEREKDPKKDGEIFYKLMIKDRAHHCKNLILPCLKYGCIVLCDRYSHSTFAYQQAQGISFKEILTEHRKYKILKPDLVFIFDVPAAIALKRIQKSRDKKELFEKVNFLEEVRQNYLKLKQLLKENIVIINNTEPLEKAFEKVREEFEKLF